MALLIGIVLLLLGGFLTWWIFFEKDADKKAQRMKFVKWIFVTFGVGLILVLSYFSKTPVLFTIFATILALFILLMYKTIRKIRKQGKSVGRTLLIVLSSVFILVFALLTAFAFSAGSEAITREYFDTVVMENIDFRGVSENSSPLGATNLLLTQGGYRYGDSVYYEYTVTGTISKNSDEPTESYFEFNVAIVDGSGKHIDYASSNLLPIASSSSNVGTLFTSGTTHRVELKVITRSEVQPVAVEFYNVKEIDKSDFIALTLQEAIISLNGQDFTEARQYVELVLRIDPNNADATVLLGEIATGEQEYLEAQAQAEAQAQEDEKIYEPEQSGEIESAPAPTPSSTSSPTPTPTLAATPSPAPTPAFTQDFALRAAVVMFTNWWADDAWLDSGDDIDYSKFHSYDDTSGNLYDYFMFVKSEGKWTEKNANTWRVEGLRLERYTMFIDGRLTPAHDITASLDVTFNGKDYVISNVSGKNSGSDISWVETIEVYANMYLTVTADLVQNDRNADEVKALDQRRGFKTDITTAQRAFEFVGNELYPYGFEVNWRRDLEESVQAHDGSWYLKAKATVTNMFNASRTVTMSAIMNNTTGSVENITID